MASILDQYEHAQASYTSPASRTVAEPVSGNILVVLSQVAYY